MEKDLTRYYTPPQIAEMLGTDCGKVLKFIALGQLRAVNISLSKRARWRVLPIDYEAFLASRASSPSSASYVEIPSDSPQPQRPRRHRRERIDKDVPKVFG